MQHRLQCTHFPGIVCTNKLNYLNIYDTENTFAASPSPSQTSTRMYRGLCIYIFYFRNTEICTSDYAHERSQRTYI